MHVEKFGIHEPVEDTSAGRPVDTAETLDLFDREPHAWHLQILRADSFEQVMT
jgi:hypothetical protein